MEANSKDNEDKNNDGHDNRGHDNEGHGGDAHGQGHGQGDGGGDDHEKTVTFIVNTRPYPWSEKTISYEQLIELVYPGQPVNPDEEEVTVRYSRGQDDSLEGSLTASHDVKVKNKMVFDVYRTARS